jgi:hypothetical protein
VTAAAPDALVEGRLLQGDGYALLFGFNRGERPVTAKFGVKTSAVRVLAIDLETGEAVQVAKDGDRAIVEKSLKPSEAWVVLLRLK